MTDNGSNFVKAFATFAIQGPVSDEVNSLEGDDDEIEQEDEVIFANVNDLIMPNQEGDDDLTQVEYELPPHQRCAAHTLNLVASTDVRRQALVIMFSVQKCLPKFICEMYSSLEQD